MFIKRKDRNNQLALYKNRNYIASVTIQGTPTFNDTLTLMNRVDLRIDWQNLWVNLSTTVNKCRYCGKPLTNDPFTKQRMYCSDECEKEYERLQSRNRVFRHRKRKPLKEYNYLEWYKNNIKPLPAGFNQIDNPKELGNSLLTSHLNSEHDFDKEEELVKKEKRRTLNLSNTPLHYISKED